MNKKKVFIIVLIIFVLIVGTTFAYFAASGGVEIFTGSSGNISITYANDGSLEGVLYPSSEKNSDLMSSVSLTLDDDSTMASANIFIEVDTISDSLASSALVWEVYINNSYYSSGTFEGATEGDDFILLSDYALSYTTTVFDVYVWLDGDNSSVNTMDSSFSGRLRASATAQAEFD